MQARATAQPNFALIKYWGKRDTARNLPAVGSLSLTLDSLQTTMSVDLDAGIDADCVSLDGEPAPDLAPRVSACLDRLLGTDRAPADVASRCNFPVAAGLASSASSFAALVTAAAAAAGLALSRAELAAAAGAASGSAARSLYSGIVELQPTADGIAVASLAAPADWPLAVVIAVTATGAKAIGSGAAMEISRQTSPFYQRWVDGQPADLEVARQAVRARDFAGLADIAEHNCLKMHSVMWASRPPVVYWNAATLRCLETLRGLRKAGVPVFFTIDAGPQVKAVCLPDARDRVRDALAATAGVHRVLDSGLGVGARRVDTA